MLSSAANRAGSSFEFLCRYWRHGIHLQKHPYLRTTVRPVRHPYRSLPDRAAACTVNCHSCCRSLCVHLSAHVDRVYAVRSGPPE